MVMIAVLGTARKAPRTPLRSDQTAKLLMMTAKELSFSNFLIA